MVFESLSSAARPSYGSCHEQFLASRNTQQDLPESWASPGLEIGVVKLELVLTFEQDSFALQAPEYPSSTPQSMAPRSRSGLHGRPWSSCSQSMGDCSAMSSFHAMSVVWARLLLRCPIKCPSSAPDPTVCAPDRATMSLSEKPCQDK